jgi:hypothetical protein
MFITDRQVRPSGARCIHFTFPHSAALRFIIIVQSHLGLSMVSVFFQTGFRLELCILFSPF